MSLSPWDLSPVEVLLRPAVARPVAFPVAAAEGRAGPSRIVRRRAQVLAAAREESREQRHDGHAGNDATRGHDIRPPESLLRIMPTPAFLPRSAHERWLKG